MDLATLGLAVDSRPVADASKELDRIREAAAKAERAADSFGARTDAAGRRAAAANDNVARSAQKVDTIYAKITRTVMAFGGALAGAFSIRVIAQMADTWSDLSARVGLAIRDMDGAAAVMDRLATVARRTYSSLALTNESFIANSTALRELGFTTAQQLDYVEGLNLALVVSGARAERAASVQNALSQAMALGVLRGDQLNTVIMTGGRVAELLAEEMGVGVNQLRALGTQGKITGDVINRALTGNLERLREEAELMPATIGDGFTLIGNAALQLVGSFDQALGASATFATGLIVVADNLQRIATYAATAATGFGVYYVGALAAAYVSTMTLTGALALLRAALIRLGITAIVVAAGELIYQFTRLVQAAGGFGNAMALLGNVAVEVWDRIKLGGSALVESLNAGWQGMKAEFLWALADMAGAFSQFIGSVAGALNSVFGTSLDTAPFSGAIGDLLAAGNAAKVSSNASSSAASGMWDRATSPLESIDALRKVYAEAGTEADTAAGAAGGFNAATTGAGGAASKAAKEAEKLANAYRKIVDGARQFIAAQELEARTIGMTEQAANALRYEQEMLNKAANDNIKLTAAQRGEIAGLAQEMSAAEAQTTALQRAFEFGKELVRGFVSDLRSGLEQGKGFWESFGKAVLGVLDKIVDKLLNNVIDAIFQTNNAWGGVEMAGRGGGGILGGLLGGIGRIFGFAEGGYTGRGHKYQPAGVVHAGEFVFSKAATDRIGIGNLNRLHARAKGYAEGGLVSAANGNVTYAPVYNIDARGAQRGAGEEIAEALRAYDRGRLGRLAADLPQITRRKFVS